MFAPSGETTVYSPEGCYRQEILAAPDFRIADLSVFCGAGGEPTLPDRAW